MHLGRLSDAAEQALAFARASLGEWHLDTLTSTNNLAGLAWSASRI